MIEHCYSAGGIKVSAADIKKYRDVAPLDMSDEALAQLIKKHNLDDTAINAALQELWQSTLLEFCAYRILNNTSKLIIS